LRPLVIHVVATRPDAVTLAPVVAALERLGVFRQLVLHTGQHTDPAMTDEMFADLELPGPDVRLDTGRGTHGTQTARALVAAEAAFAEHEPAVVVVTGAANTTLGCALAAAKLGVPVARLEAGLREHDWRAPEEVNRVVLDTTADTLFSPTAQAAENLHGRRRRGRPGPPGGKHGDRLAAAFRAPRRRARGLATVRGRARRLRARDAPSRGERRRRRTARPHRRGARRARPPRAGHLPAHPRTRERLKPMGDAHRLLAAGVLCGPPLAYLDFLSLEAGAGAVVTDSGTVQEETSALGVSCFTLRSSTERCVTLTHGTNALLGDPRDLIEVRPTGDAPTPSLIPFWDGRAGGRVADALVANYALVRATGST
jgi:UDP-N-acetylglucosamine 2-epimerase (non-hydrolysing)